MWPRTYLVSGLDTSKVATTPYYLLVRLGVVVVCLAIAGIGCARQSRKAFMFTGVGLLLTVLLFAVSMACWHYVNYLERAVLEMPPFYKSWEPILKSTTRFNFGWSLVVAWVGILFILFASVFFICSASRLKKPNFI
ncbi:unnamed protein product [Strongylus vulgaris]|uniref:Uncharacterized protein n=1 Tax=Strongylus vulgaris TaxID=40348 RepID=A0A3P7LBB4_STRVU|nr:unnamed protein product [Strongylus vulgaris]